MQSTELANQLLQEALRILNLPSGLAYDGGHAWHVALHGQAGLDVEYDDAARRVVISGCIGEVAEHSKTSMYELLLEYNFIWTETGGVRMALDGSTNQAVIMLEAPTAELDPPRLSTLLANMARLQRTWTEIVREWAFADAPSEPLEQMHGMDSMQFGVKA